MLLREITTFGQSLILNPVGSCMLRSHMQSVCGDCYIAVTVPELFFVPVKQTWAEGLHDGHDLNFIDVEIGGQRYD